MRYWQQFEQRCRSLVRSWGFDVPLSSVKKFGREFDIYGEHVLLHKKYFCPEEPSDNLLADQPLIVIGECKTSQAGPIDATAIDQLLARREDVKLELGYHTAAYLFTSTSTTKGVERAAQRHNIGIITEREVNRLAVHALLADGPGRLERSSLPNFHNFDSMLEFLTTMMNLPEMSYTVRKLQEEVKDTMRYDASKWTRDFIQHCVLLGLAEQISTTPQTYQLKEEAIPIISKFGGDLQGWKNYLRGQVLQLPWHREILYYTRFKQPDTKKAIQQGLENFKPGFDYVSLNVAVDMLQQLDLLTDELKPSEMAVDLLWR